MQKMVFIYNALEEGWKINKNLGIFAEGEYSKMWDSELFITTFGLNFTFR